MGSRHFHPFSSIGFDGRNLQQFMQAQLETDNSTYFATQFPSTERFCSLLIYG
jgi:hypothetical protein